MKAAKQTNELSYKEVDEEIMYKSKFNGSRNISLEQAIDVADWKYNNISTCKNNNEILTIINKCFKGIIFFV